MNQKRISRLLIGAGGIAVLGILVLFGVYAPMLADEMRTMYPDYAALYLPGLIGVECCGALFLLARRSTSGSVSASGRGIPSAWKTCGV